MQGNSGTKRDFVAFKGDDDKLDIHKLVRIPSMLNSLKTQVDNLDKHRLKYVSVDLKKSNDAVSKQAVTNIKFNKPNTKVNNLQQKSS